MCVLQQSQQPQLQYTKKQNIKPVMQLKRTRRSVSLTTLAQITIYKYTQEWIPFAACEITKSFCFT